MIWVVRRHRMSAMILADNQRPRSLSTTALEHGERPSQAGNTHEPDQSLTTVRQVLVWIRQHQIVLPAIVQESGVRPLEWKILVYHTQHHILTNPVYPGAYAFGRQGVRVTIEGGWSVSCVACCTGNRPHGRF
jgi:hypothetical protein